ncbi:MAG: plasmid pRiA4b ORF-3 family protein [Zoogloeaceae bacterium]|nr:plasmid pRiA4b ORF-3 family protein [Zoogloeaceae bacterium]
MISCLGIFTPITPPPSTKPPEVSNVIPLKKPRAKKIPDLLQLKIGLAWIKPAIWRRIVVPESIALGNLHQVLQITFDWCDYHLHEFDFGGERFGIPDPEFDWEPVRSETRIQLKTALGGMASFKYVYDFGDHWEHRIKVEKKLPGDPQLSQRAMLLKAANAAPPEDVGGAPGYAHFVEAMTDTNHPEHHSMHEWHGDTFDPAFVDVVAISLALHDLKI